MRGSHDRRMVKPKRDTAAANKKSPPKPAKPTRAATAPVAVKAAKPAKPTKPAEAAKPAKVAKTPGTKKIAARDAPRPAPNAKPGANAKSAKAPAPARPAAPARAAAAAGAAGARGPQPNSFLNRQRGRLLQLKDGLLDSMTGVGRDSLRAGREAHEASAFGMHQADAGSDAYDRDFALNLLSQEQDALYEIDEALKRIEVGTYGVCEMSGKAIPRARLEAIPFARFTVDCQSQFERQRRLQRSKQPVTSLFGLTDEEGGEMEEEDALKESAD